MSIRQSRKEQRNNKKDKHGFSMSLSRPQRRALRRSVFVRSYKTTRLGTITLEIGGIHTTDNLGSTSHAIYGGGSMRHH